MANHTDRPYDIDVTFIHPKTKKKVQYKMRTTVWALDMNLQGKCLTPTKDLDPTALWIGRITDCVEGMDDKTVRKLDQYTMNLLCSQWLLYNDPNSNFLEQEIPSESQNTTHSK